MTWNFDESTGALTISGTGAMTNYAYYYAGPWSSLRSYKVEVVSRSGVDGPVAGEVREAYGEASTYCSYEQYIRGHIKPQIGGKYMNTLTAEDLQDFFNERRAHGNLKGEGGLSAKTLTNLRNMMHLAFSQAVRNRLLVENLVEGAGACGIRDHL